MLQPVVPWLFRRYREPSLLSTLVVAVEEPLWRGVALDGFGSAATKASLMIGLAWSLWHVPLFFITGTFQHDLGFASLDFFVFSIGIMGLSVILTWLVVRSGGSILLAMFTHFLINLNGEFLPDDTTIRVLEMCLILLVAAVIFLRMRSGETAQHVAPGVSGLTQLPKERSHA